MLIPALLAESALGGRELGPEVDARAQSFCVFRSTELAIRILTGLLLVLLSFMLIGTAVVVCSFRSVIGIRFRGGLAPRRLVDDKSNAKSVRKGWRRQICICHILCLDRSNTLHPRS